MTFNLAGNSSDLSRNVSNYGSVDTISTLSPSLQGSTDYSNAFNTSKYFFSFSSYPVIENVNLETQPPVNSALDNLPFTSGWYTVGNTGEVSFDYLFDGGAYEGELAIFSLEGMGQYQLGSPEFTQEAVARSLSNSALGHVVISDSDEAARFSGNLNWDENYNLGEYRGAKNFVMREGDQFGLLQIPNGRVQELLNNPKFESDKHPLFSLAPNNPLLSSHFGQFKDINGSRIFAMEDLRQDGTSDNDFNDFVFYMSGAEGSAPSLNTLININRDWRSADVGKQISEWMPQVDPISSLISVPTPTPTPTLIPTPAPVDPNGALDSAVDWGTFTDKILNISDSIGYDEDLNDYFRFNVNTRSNINLALNGLSTDADFEILGRNGEFIDRSTDSATSADSLIRILESGDYYLRVYPSAGTSTNYSLALTQVNLSGKVRPESQDVNLWRYNTNGRTESDGTFQGIEPNKDTVVVIHGWQNSDQTRIIQDLANVASKSNPQVLALDWSSIAQAELDKPPVLDIGGFVPYETAKWITPVANWLEERLDKLGINFNQLSLIGHSLGAYISSETARLFGKVKNLVALDPAFPADGAIGYDTDINTPGKQNPSNFRDVSTKSLALVVTDSNKGLLGDNVKAATAHDSFLVKFDSNNKRSLNDIDAHGGIVDVFTDALSRSFLTLPELNLPNHENNWYDNNSDKDNFFDRFFNAGEHEGTIYADWTGSQPDDVNKNYWRIDKLARVIDSSGKEQETWRI
jgi:pimeloyl-ACP methyl ester carboxylesterase